MKCIISKTFVELGRSECKMCKRHTRLFSVQHTDRVTAVTVAVSTLRRAPGNSALGFVSYFRRLILLIPRHSETWLSQWAHRRTNGWPSIRSGIRTGRTPMVRHSFCLWLRFCFQKSTLFSALTPVNIPASCWCVTCAHLHMRDCCWYITCAQLHMRDCNQNSIFMPVCGHL